MVRMNGSIFSCALKCVWVCVRIFAYGARLCVFRIDLFKAHVKRAWFMPIARDFPFIILSTNRTVTWCYGISLLFGPIVTFVYLVGLFVCSFVRSFFHFHAFHFIRRWFSRAFKLLFGFGVENKKRRLCVRWRSYCMPLPTVTVIATKRLEKNQSTWKKNRKRIINFIGNTKCFYYRTEYSHSRSTITEDLRCFSFGFHLNDDACTRTLVYA